MKSILTLATFLLLAAIPSAAAENRSEQQLIEVLKSNASPREKDEACVELKQNGTALCVPALASLLIDQDLSHSARYALEPMATPEAGQALVKALPETSGTLRIGIIQSLEKRNETSAADALVQILNDQDTSSAIAAASALGQLGSADHLQHLMDAAEKTKDTFRKAQFCEAVLAGAIRLSDKKTANALLEKLMSTPLPAKLKGAVYRERIASGSEDESVQMIISGIRGADPDLRQAAVQGSRDLRNEKITSALVELLPTLSSPSLQCAVIDSLTQRGARSATTVLVNMLNHSDRFVRMTAANALGELGNASAAAPLVKCLGGSDEEEKKACRQALLALRNGDVAGALLQQLESGTPETQKALAGILAERREKIAFRLIDMASRNSSEGSRAAVLVLVRMAGVEDVPAMLRLVVDAKNSSARKDAAGALAKVLARLKKEGVSVDAEPVVQALNSPDASVKAALMPAAANLSDSRIRKCLIDAMAEKDTDFKSAAIQALCDSHDPDLLPQLHSFARTTDQPALRSKLVRGYLRLVGEETTGSQMLEAIQTIVPLTSTPEEKWTVLANVGNVGDRKSFDIAVPMLNDTTTRKEAIEAICKIAEAVGKSEPDAARAALEKVLPLAENQAARVKAQLNGL